MYVSCLGDPGERLIFVDIHISVLGDTYVWPPAVLKCMMHMLNMSLFLETFKVFVITIVLLQLE